MKLRSPLSWHWRHSLPDAGVAAPAETGPPTRLSRVVPLAREEVHRLRTSHPFSPLSRLLDAATSPTPNGALPFPWSDPPRRSSPKWGARAALTKIMNLAATARLQARERRFPLPTPRHGGVDPLQAQLRLLSSNSLLAQRSETIGNLIDHGQLFPLSQEALLRLPGAPVAASIGDFPVHVQRHAVMALHLQQHGLSFLRKSAKEFTSEHSGPHGVAAEAGINEGSFDSNASRALRHRRVDGLASQLDLCLGVLPVLQ